MLLTEFEFLVADVAFFSISNIIILLNCVVNNNVSSGTNSSVNSSVSVISNNVNGAAENSLRTISSNEFD